ncbi:UNVERIFIED_CONTAM: hypothetical protein Sradi_7079000 [Sesamum radiatum]|uniref:Reverse transcriptase zinc-binding domain-containing protein n=1 Tax=Sesamum radiatum TaxID=300843 RepID=A0AAW2J485_SESRA
MSGIDKNSNKPYHSISSPDYEVPINIYQSDYLHWRLSKNSAFTTKSAWNEIRDQQPVQQFYKSLWSKLIIPNISVFAWRLIHNWIPVDERLKEKGITLASKCLCCEDTETIPHLFLHNAHSLEAWGFFASKFQVNIPHTNDIVLLIQSWKTRLGTKSHIRDVIPLLILWNIWNLRNESKYEGVAFKASTIIRKTMTYLHNLQKGGIMDTDHVKETSSPSAHSTYTSSRKFSGKKQLLCTGENRQKDGTS